MKKPSKFQVGDKVSLRNGSKNDWAIIKEIILSRVKVVWNESNEFRAYYQNELVVLDELKE